MILKLIILVSVGAALVAGNCGPAPPIPPHYEEFGCTPVGEPPCNQPSHFKCPNWNEFDTSKCHFKGKTYNVGEGVPVGEAGPCLHCICVAGQGDGTAEFTCAGVECPEMLGSQIPPDCIGQYPNDTCCSTKTVCGAEKEALHKCSFRGKTYYKNQRLSSPYEPCYGCICDENFDGETKLQYNPKSCRKLSCNIGIFKLKELKNGCAPVYTDSNCCPIKWRCPESGDKVKDNGVTGNPQFTCKYGALTVNRFQEIETKNVCVTCSCNQPPLLTCNERVNCGTTSE